MKTYTFIAGILLAGLSSCSVQRYTVGDGPVGKQEVEKVFYTDRNFYLIGGLIPLNKPNPRLPTSGGYQIKSSFGIFDGLLTGITGGIVTSRRTKILIK